MYWQAVEQQTKKALKEEKLMPLVTESLEITQNTIQFTVHLKQQTKVKKPHQGTQKSNPFLPHEPEMFVQNVGNSHKLLLNKFPVLTPHALLCSNEFKAQQSPLQLKDFAAWHLHLNTQQDVGFYNAGPTAGASQAHRHMQLIKLTDETNLAAIAKQLCSQTFVRFGQFDAEQRYELYQQALAQFSLSPIQAETGAYNLVLSNQLFWLIPRSSPQCEGIYANGLNFCGHFLLRDRSQLTRLEKFGFISYLKAII